jgi:DNA/RNA-binding domain of Phe-tRNA-synthetase-like protein
MIVRCSHKLFEMFPGASIHGAVFEDVSRFGAESAECWKRKAQESLGKSGIKPELLVESPPIKEWRAAFQLFGVKPSKYRSSIEQLCRRALKGDIIQTKLSLVNLYCYVSLIQMVPMGGYDLRKVQGEISVRLTMQGEEFAAIGEHQPIKCDPGVVAYADDAGIICWAWNHRDAGRTCLDAETDKAIFFVDSAFHESRGRAAAAIDLLSEALSSVGATKVGAFVVDQQENDATLDI